MSYIEGGNSDHFNFNICLINLNVFVNYFE